MGTLRKEATLVAWVNGSRKAIEFFAAPNDTAALDTLCFCPPSCDMTLTGWHRIGLAHIEVVLDEGIRETVAREVKLDTEQAIATARAQFEQRIAQLREELAKFEALTFEAKESRE